MEGVWIKKSASSTAIVFVHGILSSGDVCWKHSSGTYWPDLVACDKELESVGVYVFTYKTGIFSGTYRIGDVVDALKEHMQLDGVLGNRKVIFVCHSMGGIVIRKFLVERATHLVEKKTEVGLFLVAAPSLGSDYANFFGPLAKLFHHSQADALRFTQSNAWLMDLDREFKNLKESQRVPMTGKELVEDTFIVLKALVRQQIVQPFSGARYFGEPYKVPGSDHFSIAKVKDQTAIQHRLLRQFILDFLKWLPNDDSTKIAAKLAAHQESNVHVTAAPAIGIDANASSDPDALQESLARLASGIANSNDQKTLQHALFQGMIVMAGHGGQTPVGTNASGVRIVSGNKSISVDHGSEFGQALRKFLLPPRPGRLPPQPQLLLIGRSAALAEVKSRLGVSGGQPMHDRTVIRGWPGVGKTTLVNALAYDVEIAARFPDGVLWTSLTREPGILAELATWGRAFGLNDIARCPSVKEAVDQVSRQLTDARMLLIIDDVWDPVHALPFLQTRGPNCGVLLTTRLPAVASALGPTPDAVYTLPLLDEVDGLTLLRLLAPEVVTRNNAICVELVRDLECLPLALHVAGRLLDTESRMGWGVDELLVRLRDGAAVIEAKAPADRADVENQTIPTVAALLHQSSEALTGQARECFALLGAFAPKPATFDLDAMKAVWQIESPKEILRELASRGLVEPISGRFQMHALLVAHARSLLDSQV